MTTWRTATNAKRVGENEIRADLRLDADSPWFSGHFPGYPVLPGIAQLHAVFDSIRKIDGENLKITGVRRVRFKQIVSPGDAAVLIVTKNSDDKRSYSFKMTVDDKVACSGIVVAEKTEPKP